jgi:hypothetical protein
MTLEKAGSWIVVIGFVAAVVLAYANLNNRLDNVDNRIAGIQKTLGSAACNAILPRQIEAIEKNHREALKALEGLSKQYHCGPQEAVPSVFDYDVNFGNAMNASAAINLSAQLNSVDVLLNASNASDAPQSKGER